MKNSKDNGILVYLDKKHVIAHNKVIIIDGKWVHTGSFNFSASAETRNAENSVWCMDQTMANVYLENYKLHMTHSVVFD